MVDFLSSLNPAANRLYLILSLEYEGDALVVLLGDGVRSGRRVRFRGVEDFRNTLFGAANDTDRLPQDLIGFDYWGGASSSALHEWELNGNECTWNFRAPLPEVKEV